MEYTLKDFNKNTIFTPITPIDGRYRQSVKELTNTLSQAALNRSRVIVEIEWIIYLLETNIFKNISPLNKSEKKYLYNIISQFDENSILRLQEIENITKHDVKAVEYYIKEKLLDGKSVFKDRDLSLLKEIVHIFATSEDINNIAIALNVKNTVENIWMPKANELLQHLKNLAKKYADTPMLSHTHGQPATPTTVGKEIAVFAYRLQRQIQHIASSQYLAKFNGATGTYSAHKVCFEKIEWQLYTKNFIEKLNLQQNPLTTQIESHDWQSELYDNISRFNRIAHNLATDMWTYISLEYFKQNLTKHGSTGSSTMPHKINPIKFENAEANLEISNSLFNTLSATLTTSRMQRDLTDSSSQRNISVAFAHSLLAINSLNEGLDSIEINENKLNFELDNNVEVLSEAIQQVMRVLNVLGYKNFDKPYERLKELTRGKKITINDLHKFIDDQKIPEKYATKLKQLKPEEYTGIAAQLVENINNSQKQAD